MCSEVWWIWTISSLKMLSDTSQCLIMLRHLKFRPPYIVRELDGKGMTPLQVGISLLPMKP